MNVKYTENARGRAKDSILLEQATKELEKIVGKSVKRLEKAFGPEVGAVEVEWDRTQDAQGEPRYVLKLRNLTDEVQTSFNLLELSVPLYVTSSLYGLWDKLLAIRSDRQMQKIQEMVDQLQGD